MILCGRLSKRQSLLLVMWWYNVSPKIPELSYTLPEYNTSSNKWDTLRYAK